MADSGITIKHLSSYNASKEINKLTDVAYQGNARLADKQCQQARESVDHCNTKIPGKLTTIIWDPSAYLIYSCCSL
jgi:hypothetical protein